MNSNILRACLAALFLVHATVVHGQSIFRSGDEVIVQISRLDQMRQSHRKLKGHVKFMLEGRAKDFVVDLSDALIPEALVFDVTGVREVSSVALTVTDGAGKVVLTQRASPVARVNIRDALPAQAGVIAAMEPGSKADPEALPRIALPDTTKMRTVELKVPARTVKLDDITYPVFADADLPGPASYNYVVVSRQSSAPADVTKCSLYFSYRKAMYDTASTKLKEWRKMLVEVPLDRSWLEKQGDEVITLPLDRFAIHTTGEREVDGQRWDAPEGYNMLGGSSSGLYQGGQSAEEDDEGRIYISNVADGAGLVRFNPHSGQFEQPPINLMAELRKFLPASDDWKRSWDADDAKLVCARGRVYIVFDRNYRVNTPNGRYETCSGVVSLPQAHWDDAAAFRQDLRLHAGCWPDAAFPLYRDEPATGGGARKAGGPAATSHGLTFGTFRLDLDANGNTQRLARIQSIQDAVDAEGRPLPPAKVETTKGLPRQRMINVGSAGRQFVRQAYGEVGISRAALALTLPGALEEHLVGPDGRHRSTYPGAPAGELTIRFDITAKLKAEPQRYGDVAASMAGISQGPNYTVIALPDEADQAIGVCEYNYFYSKLDFSRRGKERKVFKSYLPLLSNGEKTAHPASVGLGPYHSTWITHDDAQWLYISGYTGISRLKYAEAGKTLPAFRAETVHVRLSPQPIEGVARDSVKDFLYVLPATDGRLINIGRGRVGRGGGARSAGLELFDPRTLGPSQTAVEMNRCYGLFTPVSRMVYSIMGAAPRQEIFAASGNIRPEYVADIDDPERRPKNQDPKIFAYDCASGAGLRDLYGFSLPLVPGGDSAANIGISPCRQFLVMLQGGGTVLAYHLAGKRFVDGIRLIYSAAQPVHPLSFSKPSASIWAAPDGRIFFHAAPEGEQGKRVSFYEVRIDRDGQLTVEPHLGVNWEKEGQVRDFSNIVRCFLPDLRAKDGSYDLVLGGDSDNGGQPTVRVIDDFILP